MSSSKRFFAIFATVTLFCATVQYTYADAPAARYDCPHSFESGNARFKLVNASVYNGPPEAQIELVPQFLDNGSRWELKTQMDPYIVCRFENVKHTITFHAQGAKFCETRDTPFEAHCQ